MSEKKKLRLAAPIVPVRVAKDANLQRSCVLAAATPAMQAGYPLSAEPGTLDFVATG